MPTIGRSGDSPVSDGASSGLAVKSERTWSGWLVTVTASGGGAVHAEDLAELAAGAEDELDLALVEAQRLDQARERDLRRRGQPLQLGRLDRPGGRGRRLAAARLGVGGSRSSGLGHRESLRRSMHDPSERPSSPIGVRDEFTPIHGAGRALYSLETGESESESGVHVERRTKIIATVGPASWDAATLEQLIAAGADVFRLNFSHAGPERQAETIVDIRAAAERVGREVAVLGDLPGPKLRIGELRDDFAELETGMHVTLTPREVEGDGETIPVSWPGVTDLQRGPARLPGRRRDPAAGQRPRARRRRLRDRGGGDALLAQGDEHPRRRRPAGDDRGRPRLGRVRGRERRRPARRLLRLHRRRPGAGGRAAEASSAPTSR